MPYKDPERAKENKRNRRSIEYENRRKWLASLTTDQIEKMKARARERRRLTPSYRENEKRSEEKNREKRKERARESYRSNPTKKKKTNSKWRVANSEYSKRKSSEWYESNKEYAKAKALEKYWESKIPKKSLEIISCLSCGKPFTPRNLKQSCCCKKCGRRDYSARYNTKLRSKNKTDRPLDPGEWLKLMIYFGWRCGYCLKKTNQLEIDHIQPVSRKGNNDPINLIPSCVSCNRRKSDKNLIEFMFLKGSGIRLRHRNNT